MPTAFARFDAHCRNYFRDWHLINEALYDLCARYPGHSQLGQILAKVLIIGRSYNTGLERRMKSSGGMGEGIAKVGRHIYEHRGEVDGIFERLRTIAEPLSVEELGAIIAEHGRFHRLLREVTRNHGPVRSFASKYMHFHCPAVPIYDSVSSAQLRKFVRWRDDLMVFGRIPEADPSYHWHVARFWKLYGDLMGAGKPVTARLVDVFLLWEREAGS
jgi:hypothetical protein